MKNHILPLVLIFMPITQIVFGKKSSKNHLKKNVVFILSDDHRYDFMGFMGKVEWLETPNLDLIAKNGAHIKNAFVTTSLSSPSRASILTGLFSHEHKVVDNEAPLTPGLTFFPEYLQKSGYKTAFFGKWHMGNTGDQPQPGFHHWESFKGQGTYYGVSMNVNGKQVTFPDSAYITDLLTEHAMHWIKEHKKKPFFVYLSHKAVHDNFLASKKHTGKYKECPIPYPESFNNPNYGLPRLPYKSESLNKPRRNTSWYGNEMKPDWVKNQRESWHGVDYSYHGRTTFEVEFRKYCETLTSLDESIGNLMTFLKEEGLEENTIVIYMGDNGFCWGEHGLIDKRQAYEESIRVPLLAYCPGLIKPGTVVEQMIQNIDIAPTIMEIAGIKKKSRMRGDSFLPFLKGENVTNWRDRLFYEYYWEYDYPQTPTTFSVRTDRYKYIRYHGIWDTNELYDIQQDPYELKNLIGEPSLQDTVKALAHDLFDWLEKTNGMNIPLKRMVKQRYGDHRNGKNF